MPEAPDWDALYRDHIHPAFAVPQGGQERPRCVFVTGPQGSGKTTILRRLSAELGHDVTQSIVPDALLARIDTHHADSPLRDAAVQAYRTTHCATHCQWLADHAVARRAHILWERAIPGTIERLALAVRRLGYRAELLVLATPVEESWLATLTRSLAANAEGDRTALQVGWPILCETALRWPVVLDRAEAELTFDRIAILDRDGEICFENHAEDVPDAPDARHWQAERFAVESLIVERARPRSDAALAALLADWTALHPTIAAENHPAWPPHDLHAFDHHLRDLIADPASRFDLNNPDPATAPGWIARLTADLAAVCASPEVRAQPGLAPRAERLVALVSQLCGQPTR